MASVFKRTKRKPIPPGATITDKLVAMPVGATMKDGVAWWTDRDGCKRSGLIRGSKVLRVEATWKDGHGKTVTRPVDHEKTVTLWVDRNWLGAFDDQFGKRDRKSTGTNDREAALRIAKKWESEAQLRVEGVIDSVGEGFAKHAMLPINEQVAAFIRFRATKGGTESHRDRTRKHIEDFVTAGSWRTVRDIKADDVTKRVEYWNELGQSARTIESRLQSIKSFSRWLTRQRRIPTNLLEAIEKPDPKTDRRQERRMILPDEWPWIVNAMAQSSDARNSMEPNERLLLYQLAIQTGLRANEIHGLTRGKLVLSDKAPHVLCKPAGRKNKKPAKQYIDTQLASELKLHISTKHPKASVFGMGSKEELSRTLEADLSLARSLWVRSLRGEEKLEAESSDFLNRENHEGEVLVFHSLRHTCGAWLARQGEHPKTIQAVMRHGTITLTMDAYGHLFPGQAEDAVGRIASVMGEKAAKTGRRRPK